MRSMKLVNCENTTALTVGSSSLAARRAFLSASSLVDVLKSFLSATIPPWAADASASESERSPILTSSSSSSSSDALLLPLLLEATTGVGNSSSSSELSRIVRTSVWEDDEGSEEATVETWNAAFLAFFWPLTTGRRPSAVMGPA
jgi:hypothetical protein